MESLLIIFKVLLAISGINFIIFIIVFLKSKCRRKKEVITESYPAEKY